VPMVLILIFGEALGLYGLIVGIILSQVTLRFLVIYAPIDCSVLRVCRPSSPPCAAPSKQLEQFAPVAWLHQRSPPNRQGSGHRCVSSLSRIPRVVAVHLSCGELRDSYFTFCPGAMHHHATETGARSRAA
jgi:hypothetical protein